MKHRPDRSHDPQCRPARDACRGGSRCQHAVRARVQQTVVEAIAGKDGRGRVGARCPRMQSCARKNNVTITQTQARTDAVRASNAPDTPQLRASG